MVCIYVHTNASYRIECDGTPVVPETDMCMNV